MTRTLSRWKGQSSRSPGRFTHRGVNASGSCSGERGNVLAVGTYCYVAVCTLQARSDWRREALRRPRGGEGGGILWRLRAYSLLICGILPASAFTCPSVCGFRHFWISMIFHLSWMYNVFLFLLLLLNVASCQLNWLTFHSSNSSVLLICLF